MRLADHAKERVFLFFTVDRPLSIKDLVTAVFGVGLSEHHQFDVGRIALGLREGVRQVIDFIVAHGQTHREVGFNQRFTTATEQVDRDHGLTGQFVEDGGGFDVCVDHAFGHAIVQDTGHLSQHGSFRRFTAEIDVVERTAFQTSDHVETAIVGDIGCLTSPGADRTQARDHHKGSIGVDVARIVTVAQKCIQAIGFVGGQFTGGVNKMHEATRNSLGLRSDRLDRLQKTGCTEVRQSAGRFECKHDTGSGHEMNLPNNRNNEKNKNQTTYNLTYSL